MSQSEKQLLPPKLQDEMRAKPVSHSETVYAGIVWEIQQETVEFAPGNTFKRDFVKHTGAAAVLAFDSEEKVILIKQYRHPAGGYLWEIPAGLLDKPGEDPMETAKRELLEETDYVPAEIEHLLSYFPTPGGSNELLHLYVAKGCQKSSGSDFLKEAEEAELEIATFEFAEILKSVQSGKLQNGPLLTAVLAYAAKTAAGTL